MTTGVMIGEVSLGEGYRTAIIAPVLGSRVSVLRDHATLAREAPVDILEVRLDHLLGEADVPLAQAETTIMDALRAVRAAAPSHPLLATIRTASEGGTWSVTDDVYAELLGAIAKSGLAEALDVEIARHPAAISSVLEATEASGIPVVFSRHYFESTPPREAMLAMLEYMTTLAPPQRAIAKLAVMPQCPEDVLALLSASLDTKRRLEHPLITIAMGHLGRVSRLAGEVFGSDASFATVGPQSAPGQLSASTLAIVLDR